MRKGGVTTTNRLGDLGGDQPEQAQQKVADLFFSLPLGG
jgi:hypothetical protein